jgi:hypothetical protein
MAILGSLNLLFKADTRKATKGINKFQGSVSGVSSTVKALGVGLAAAFSASYFKNVAKGIDEQAKFADRVGASFKVLQNLQFAAGEAGVGINALNIGIQRMTRRIGESLLKNTGMAKDTIERLGFSLEEFRNLRSDQQFLKIGQAIGKVENQSEKLALTFSLFDTEGAALVNLFDQMKDSTDGAVSSLDQLGVTLTRLDAAKIEKANDALGRTELIFGAIGKLLTVAIADPLTVINNRMVEFAKSEEGINKIRKGFETFSEVFASVVGALNIVQNAFSIFFKGIQAGISKFISVVLKLGSFVSKKLGFDELSESIKGFEKAYDESAQKTFESLLTDVQDIKDEFQGKGVSKSLIDEIRKVEVQTKKTVENIKKSKIPGLIKDAPLLIKDDLKITMEDISKTFGEPLKKTIKAGFEKAAPALSAVFDTANVDVSALATISGGNVEKQQLTVQEKMNKSLNEISKNTSGNQVAVFAV